jgi:hypothetical protein
VPRIRLQLELLETRNLLSGTWTQLASLAPSDAGTNTMMLLSDGTVMVQGGGTPTIVTKTWYQLTPDSSGGYINGAWSQLPSMGLEREWYASNVLPDGRVFVLGGEDSGPNGNMNWTNTGEMYDPLANNWTGITNFPRTQFGDDPSEVLPDGRVLVGYLSGPQTYIYNPATDTWTEAGTKLRNDRSDEETWVKLPDDSILSYDVFDAADGVAHSQRYIPAQDQWVDAGDVPVILSTLQVGYELGPAFLLPDGRVFQLGATGQTAYYDPSSNSWTAGPDIPNDMTAADVPGAIMPNGKILFAADPMPFFSPPTTIYEFDPTTNTYTDVTPSDYDLSRRPNDDRMVVLPTGQVLLSNSTDQLIVYTPDGGPDPSWQPQIRRIHDNHDGTYHLQGYRLNGLSEGANFGDDAEMSTNYPIIRLDDGNGNIFYARTYNWSSTGVATGNTLVSTDFTLPAGIPPVEYALSVIASGIASDPVSFTVPGFGGPAAPTRVWLSNAVEAGANGIRITRTAADAGAPTASRRDLDPIASVSGAAFEEGIAVRSRQAALSSPPRAQAEHAPAQATLDGFFVSDPWLLFDDRSRFESGAMTS